jgi:hypothetical protein
MVLFIATYWAFVGTETGQRVENLALRGAELRSSATRDAALARLTQISVVMFALATMAVWGTGLLRRRGGLGTLAASVMLGSVLSAEVLKELLPRPQLVTGPSWILRNTFPSGTATVATAVAVGAFLVTPERLRWTVVPIAAVYAAVIAEALQAAGWHRLSDTVGSSLLVIALAFAGLTLLARAGLVQRSPYGRVDRRIRGALLVVATILIALGGLLLLLLSVFPLLTTPAEGRGAFLQTAFPLLGAGSTVLMFLVFAQVVEPFSLGRGVRARSRLPLPAGDTVPPVRHTDRHPGV